MTAARRRKNKKLRPRFTHVDVAEAHVHLGVFMRDGAMAVLVAAFDKDLGRPMPVIDESTDAQ